MTSFDIFRLNCFLNDTKANDFKRIIISLVCEYLFDNNNKETSIYDCHSYILNYHKIEIEKDYFIAIVSSYPSFEQTPVQSDILIKLKSKKFAEINDSLKEHSIEAYIANFLLKKNLSTEFLLPIKSLLYQAVYENINTFSTENLSKLISEKINDSFTKEEIQSFNCFIEDSDIEKNTAVYNVFLKATEFAIITSGKGIKEFSKDIFKGKTYCLDTNILFRLLGIGGEERKNSLINLIKYCVHQGITFEYTSQTLQELKRKLNASVKFLQSTEAKYDIYTLGELSETDPNLFNEDFVLHYSKLRSSGKVANAERYEIHLLSEFKKLEAQLNFTLAKGSIKIEEKNWTAITNELFANRKSLPHGYKYTRTAAKTDAYNILYVRKLRGDNNYNYTDVKSFYLTTDRTLNQILSKDRKIIPETILPSQLFILHNPYTTNGEEVDYELFLQFIKRRTTEFHFKGTEVLTFIDSIRQQTSSKEEMRNILNVYADKRYEISNDHNIEDRKVRPIQEIIETVIDKKIHEGQINKSELANIKNNADKRIPNINFNTKWTVRIFDILITILIIPVAITIIKMVTQEISIIIIVTVVAESIKFLITSKTRLWNIVWYRLLTFSLKTSSYYKLSHDGKYISKGLEEYNRIDGEIWKKSKTSANSG